MQKEEKLKRLWSEQIRFMGKIQKRLNLNIVYCCKCGGAVIVKRIREEFICPHCLEQKFSEDCEDFIYENMQVEGMQIQSNEPVLKVKKTKEEKFEYVGDWE
jgi:reverse gyrase